MHEGTRSVCDYHPLLHALWKPELVLEAVDNNRESWASGKLYILGQQNRNYLSTNLLTDQTYRRLRHPKQMPNSPIVSTSRQKPKCHCHALVHWYCLSHDSVYPGDTWRQLVTQVVKCDLWHSKVCYPILCSKCRENYPIPPVTASSFLPYQSVEPRCSTKIYTAQKQQKQYVQIFFPPPSSSWNPTTVAYLSILLSFSLLSALLLLQTLKKPTIATNSIILAILLNNRLTTQLVSRQYLYPMAWGIFYITYIHDLTFEKHPGHRQSHGKRRSSRLSFFILYKSCSF